LPHWVENLVSASVYGLEVPVTLKPLSSEPLEIDIRNIWTAGQMKK